MIGTCVAWHPLQLIPDDDRRIRGTLETLTQKFLVDGMFYQDFIHSGMNAYLTLHLAHSWLHGGSRAEFWKLFSAVTAHASPTLNFPEAIHPRTGGGAMGDGHHGWAAAEVCLALRDAFVREVWGHDEREPELVLLSGIPPEWFEGESPGSITNAPIPGGTISLQSKRAGNSVCVSITLVPKTFGHTFEVSIRLPMRATTLRVNGSAGKDVRDVDGETWISCGSMSGEVELEFEAEENAGYSTPTRSPFASL
jgi:hypothetical protein